MNAVASFPTFLKKESEKISFEDESDDLPADPPREPGDDRSTAEGFAVWSRLCHSFLSRSAVLVSDPVDSYDDCLFSAHGPAFYAVERVSNDTPMLAIEPPYQLVASLGNRSQRQAEHQQNLNGLAAFGPLALGAITAFIESSPTDEVIRDAASVISDIATTNIGYAAVKQLAAHQDSSIRTATIRALGVGDEATYSERADLLSAALLRNDDNAEVRDAAASSLGQLGGPAALEILRRALDAERDSTVRDAIEQAISDLDD